MSTEPTRPDAASIERGRQIAESMMDDATAAYRRRLAEECSETTHASAVEPVEPPAGPERGTGGPEAHGAAQAGGYTPAETIYRILVLPWGTRHNREHVREVAEGIDVEIRPAYYREVAVSLERLGHTAAAKAVRSTARDLTDDLKGTS